MNGQSFALTSVKVLLFRLERNRGSILFPFSYK